MNERILVVDDESSSREGLRRLLEAWDYQTVTAASGQEALDQLSDPSISAVITDLVMPGLSGIDLVRRIREEHTLPVIVLSGQGTIELAVEAIQQGASDFLEKPVEPEKLKLLLQKLSGTLDLIEENRRLRAELKDRGTFGDMRGISDAMQAVYRQVEQVAPSTLSVLVHGESGTGKELVARTVHDLSQRRRRPFIAVNCAAIPESLLESEIFGHERGAFTGATQRKIGCFEMADSGTLFLDEIAEMDENLQAKLLRVLQEGSFRRLGGREIVETDVRVVAATNREPKTAIREGRLREDLYYRLNVFSIAAPALRERPEDIPFLAGWFLETEVDGDPPTIHPDAAKLLFGYRWPGNVRELKNAMHRALLLCGKGPILPDHLPPDLIAEIDPQSLVADPDEIPAPAIPTGGTMRDIEKRAIESTLLQTEGNKTQAARILGISLKTIHNKVKKYRL